MHSQRYRIVPLEGADSSFFLVNFQFQFKCPMQFVRKYVTAQSAMSISPFSFDNVAPALRPLPQRSRGGFPPYRDISIQRNENAQ